MARKRMLSTELISSDRFLELSKDAQLLYFHMSTQADDDGFVASVRRISLYCGVGSDAIEALEKGGFVIRFPSGVAVIVHWRVNNNIRKDRSVETVYRQELARLTVEDGRYILREDPVTTANEDPDNQVTTANEDPDNQVTTGNANPDNQVTTANANPDNQVTTANANGGNRQKFFAETVTTQNRTEKNIIDKNIIEKNRIDQNRTDQNSGERTARKRPSVVDVQLYCEEQRLENVDATDFWSYYYLRDWKQGEQPLEDWKAAARAWDRKERRRW